MIAKYSSNNSLQQNINLTISIIIFSFYFFGITLVPLIQAKIALKNKNLSLMHTLASKQKNTSLLNNHIVSYIKAGNVIARSVDNSSFLQSYLSDIKGSITKLITADKNATPGLTYKYDAYGKPILNNEHNEAVVNPFTYNGERYDDHSGLQYLRARFYLPNLKRFATLDTLDLINRTNYASSNPIMASDPSGHFSMFGLNGWQLAGIAVGLVGLYFGIKAGFATGTCSFWGKNISQSTLLSTTDNSLNALGMQFDNFGEGKNEGIGKTACNVAAGLISGALMGMFGGWFYNRINEVKDGLCNGRRAVLFSEITSENSTKTTMAKELENFKTDAKNIGLPVEDALVEETARDTKKGTGYAINEIKNSVKADPGFNNNPNFKHSGITGIILTGARTAVMETIRYPFLQITSEAINMAFNQSFDFQDFNYHDFLVKLPTNIALGFIVGAALNGGVILASNRLAMRLFIAGRSPETANFARYAISWTAGIGVQIGLPYAEVFYEENQIDR